MTTPPISIVFAHRGGDWIRGSEQCLLDLIARLDPARFRPVVLCEQPKLAEAVASLGIAVERLNHDWGFFGQDPEPRVLRRFLRAYDVSLIHVNAPSLIPTLLPVARDLRVPLVAHVHVAIAPDALPAPMRATMDEADMIVGVSERVIAPIRAAGIAQQRLRVIYNGVDAERIQRGSATRLRTELKISPGATVVVSVGALTAMKGHDVTIRAIANARARGADVHLLICGDGEERENLRALAEQLEVQAYVHLLGYRNDAGAIMRDAGDMLVAFSRDEALGLNVLEAQLLGLAVVASDIPAHHEALEDGVSGVLAPRGDPMALADVVCALAITPARRASLGSAGQRIAAERFAMTQYVSAFEALYAEVLRESLTLPPSTG